MALRSNGNKPGVKRLKEINPSFPSTSNVAQEILNAWKLSEKPQPEKYNAEEALSMVVTNNYSKRQYIRARNGAVKKHHDFYSSYDVISQAKNTAYPPNLVITDAKCEVPLQNLLNHMACRILDYLNLEVSDDLLEELVLIFKWGYDGSSGYSSYKQSLGDIESDEHLFTTSTVPLRLENKDGKVCNALTDTSSQSCYICKAKISQFNNLEKVMQTEENEEYFSFSLSILHAHIKCFECILHIAYRRDFKTWKVSAKDKEQFDQRKKEVQDGFLKELHLKVDFPKQGFGSSNDGNTARRFFQNTAKSAEITGIDEGLIHRFKIILQVLSSKEYHVKAIDFKEYCFDTAKMYVTLYSWYHMPPTVHKILIHGPSIVNDAALLIGQLSEEALEANHKVCKQFRQNFTRKHSRKVTNEDMFHRLLLRSDPFKTLSGVNYDEVKKKNLHPDAVALLDISLAENEEFGESFSAEEED